MAATEVVVGILVVGAVAWWQFGGKRRMARRMKYNAEKRQEQMDAEDQAWREKQEEKRARRE